MSTESAHSAPSAADQPALGLARDRARALALAAGFTEASLVALPYAAEARDADRFAAWVRSGRAGTMQYLERTGEDGQLTRERVRVPFPWARSALVCFSSYLYPDEPLSTKTQNPRSGWIARYAWSSKLLPSKNDAKGERRPSDYHKVLLKRLRDVEARLHAELGRVRIARVCRYGPGGGARAGRGGRPGMGGQKHVPDSSATRLVGIFGGAADFARNWPASKSVRRGGRVSGPANWRTDTGSRPLRHLPALH